MSAKPDYCAQGESGFNEVASAVEKWNSSAMKRPRSCRMKRDLLRAKALMMLLGVCLGFAELAGGAETREAEWVSLFNGKDLHGWERMHDAMCIVTNGNLRLVAGMGWLRTTDTYTNFILEVEWRALEPQYNSGCFVRAQAAGKPWPKDVWQINLSGAALGGLLKGSRTVVPAETPWMPLNKWVKFRIEARGKKITLEVNGERAWEYNELDAAQGYIGIQAENKSFEFRTVRIQKLPDSGEQDRK